MNGRHNMGGGGMGSGGYCICPKCNTRIPHRPGIRFQEEVCPKCGAKMLREGGYHHELFLKNKKNNNE